MRDVLRGVDHLLRRSGARPPWYAPAAGAAWTAILVVVGILTGMSVAQFLPIATIQGLVLGGLVLVAAMPPVDAPPDDDGGGGRRRTEPPSLDPAVWGALFDGSVLDGEARAAHSINKEEREPAPTA